jgi:hypothetical protein
MNTVKEGQKPPPLLQSVTGQIEGCLVGPDYFTWGEPARRSASIYSSAASIQSSLMKMLETGGATALIGNSKEEDRVPCKIVSRSTSLGQCLYSTQ